MTAAGLVPPGLHQLYRPPPLPGPAPGSSAGRFRQVIIVGSGGELLVYSPTEDTGNLIASIAGAAGTDAKGNAFLQGFTTYTHSGGTFYAININGQKITLTSAASAAGPYSTINATIALDSTFTNLVLTAANEIIMQPLNGQTVPFQPSANIPEVWHSLVPTHSWTGSFQYRLTLENTVRLSFQLTAPGSGVNNVTIVTLPPGYQPTSTRTFPIASDAVTSGEMAIMIIDSSGNVQVNHLLANATNVSGEMEFPLGL